VPADYSQLADWLRGKAQDVVTIGWEELDQLVGGLPASAVSHYPQWWHGDRPNTRGWRSAGFELDQAEPLKYVRFKRRATGSFVASPKASQSGAQSVAIGDVDALLAIVPRTSLIVLSCSADKVREGSNLANFRRLDPWPPSLIAARLRIRDRIDLDESTLLPAWRRYSGHFYAAAGAALSDAIEQDARVVILSGGYGLVDAREPIGIYNKALKPGDWPPGLLEGLLVDKAAAPGVRSVVAFAGATTAYARLVRRSPWRRLAGVPVLLVTVDWHGGGALAAVPRQLGNAFSAFWYRDARALPSGIRLEVLA
jgi:hypothetical protein